MKNLAKLIVATLLIVSATGVSTSAYGEVPKAYLVDVEELQSYPPSSVGTLGQSSLLNYFVNGVKLVAAAFAGGFAYEAGTQAAQAFFGGSHQAVPFDELNRQIAEHAEVAATAN